MSNQFTISASATDEYGTYDAGTLNVTVNNISPTVTLTGNDIANVGKNYVLHLGHWDPGGHEIESWWIDWGDSQEIVSGAVSSLTHVYPAAGQYTITAAATEADGMVGANSLAVDVEPVVITLSGPSTILDTATYQLGFSVVDPAGTPISYFVYWGDGTYTFLNAPASSASHIYPAGPGTYNITVMMGDEYGQYTSDPLNVTVYNFTIAGDEATDEGAGYLLNLASSAGSGTITSWLIDWGDGNDLQLVEGNPAIVAHTYKNGPNNYTIQAWATNESGTYAANTIDVHVNNVAPTLSDLTLSQSSIDEGGSVTLSGMISEPGILDTLTLLVDWADGSVKQSVALAAGTTSFSIAHTYQDDNPTATFTDTASIQLKVSDQDGGNSSASIDLTVNNVNPTITGGGNLASFLDSAPPLLEGEVSDLGTLDTFVLHVRLDGGDDMPQSAAIGHFEIQASNAPGPHSVNVWVTDDDTGISSVITYTYNIIATCITTTEIYDSESDSDDTYHIQITTDDDQFNLSEDGRPPAGANVLANDTAVLVHSYVHHEYWHIHNTQYDVATGNVLNEWDDPQYDRDGGTRSENVDAGPITLTAAPSDDPNFAKPDPAWTLNSDGTFVYVAAPDSNELVRADSFTYLAYATTTYQDESYASPTSVSGTVTLKVDQSVSITIDGVKGEYKKSPNPGGLIRVNDDFSKDQYDPQSNPVPDKRYPGNIFDPQYARDLVPATVVWLNGASASSGQPHLSLQFDDDIVVWNVTGWDGNLLYRPERILSLQDLTPSGTRLDLLIEGITASSSIGAGTILASVTSPDPGVATAFSSSRYTVVSLTSAVDGNRNGQMEYDNFSDTQKLFWYNNNADNGKMENDSFDGTAFDDMFPLGIIRTEQPTIESEAEPSAGPNTGNIDSADDVISSMRDLEDFFPYYVKIDPLLLNLLASPTSGYSISYAVRNDGNTPPPIRFFGQARDGSDFSINRDVTSVATALSQVSDTNSRQAAFGVGATNAKPFDIIMERFFNSNTSTIELIAELVGDTNAHNQKFEVNIEFTVSGPNNYTRTFSTVMTIDARRIDNFYDRFEVVPPANSLYAIDFPSLTAASFPDAQAYYGSVRNQPFFDGRDYTVLVHGWNMDDYWKEVYVATAYKRLYWQGYDGGVGTFNWPTLVDGALNNDYSAFGPSQDTTYNVSEYEALRSGLALRNLLAQLDEANSNVNVLAHSMGNYVVAE